MLLTMDDSLFKRSWWDLMKIFTGGGVNILLWAEDTLMESLGLSYMLASMLAYIVFIQILAISTIALMVPFLKFPVETFLFYFCMIIFVWSGEADFLWKKKQETSEKDPMAQNQPKDTKRIFSFEERRKLLIKEKETLESYQVEISSRYHSLLKDHTSLISHCQSLTTQNNYLRDKLRFPVVSMNPEPIPEVKLVGHHASSLDAVRPNCDLLKGGFSNLLGNKQNGTSPSTGAIKFTESSEGEDVKFSSDPEAVKLSADLESVKSALHTEVVKLIVDFETFKSAVDPEVVKFTADSETVKFSAESRGVKFAANGQDVKTEDPKECEWEVIDASLHDC